MTEPLMVHSPSQTWHISGLPGSQWWFRSLLPLPQTELELRDAVSRPSPLSTPRPGWFRCLAEEAFARLIVPLFQKISKPSEAVLTSVLRNSAPLLDQTYTQATSWGGSVHAEQGVPPVTSSYAGHRGATIQALFPTPPGSIFAHSRPTIKLPVRAPLAPLGHLPESRSPCSEPLPVARDISLPETQGTSRVVGLICDCEAYFPKQGFDPSPDLTRSHGAERRPLPRHGPASSTGSYPQPRDIGRSSWSDPPDNSTFVLDNSPHLCKESLPIQLRPIQSPPDKPHITEQETFHATCSTHGGRDLENAALTSRPHVVGVAYDIEANQHNSTANDTVHLPRESRAATTLTPTPAENALLPTQDDHHRTRAPATHRNAAEVFLGVTQRSSRERSLEDSLERGIMRNGFEDESGISSLMDINAFGHRTKAIIVSLVLGIVLLGAVAKLAQTIQSQSTTH